ncbi:single-stranded DNA-binding protein [Romboutsia sp. Marseille-P6047]|uniref:single-stranded DNA-binding protein n=1 Tax=Romboutsia sp. Marseille-P6047 TaxID=2161817 RepID=UPI000F05DE5B|nr:single-stranded DNA-binding protein [Romboutsia sp. Marseille-P6047]
MNNISIVGRLTKQPELRYIPGTGTAVASFTVAVDRDYIKNDGSRETDFIPVEIMGKKAEACAQHLVKGSLVSLSGSLRVDNYTKDNKIMSFTKVAAKNCTFLDNRNKINENKKEFDEIDDTDIPFL